MMPQLNKPRVLLVPAWYPEITDPLLGSFFQEQLRLLKDDFDFKVLIGQRLPLGRKTAIKQILNSKFVYSKRVDNKYTQQEHTIALDYLYVKLLPKRLEKKQDDYLNKLFGELFEELIQTDWKPNLIHIQSLSDSAVFVCNLAEKYQIPVILTEHNVYSFRGNIDFFENEKQRVYERVSKVLCVSNHVLRHLLINNFNLKSFSVVGNLLNDSRFIFSDNKKESAENQIIFVANHLGCKDFHILIQTAKIMVESGFIDFVINVVGLEINKPYYYDSTGRNCIVNEEVEKSGLVDYFIFKGIVPRDKILVEYSECSLLVSTSYSETFGLAITEALMCGLPVVCTNSGGPQDYVNETNGIIVPIRDPNSLANAIIYMLKNIMKYDKRKISNEICEKYGVKAFSERIKNEYNQFKCESLVDNF